MNHEVCSGLGLSQAGMWGRSQAAAHNLQCSDLQHGNLLPGALSWQWKGHGGFTDPYLMPRMGKIGKVSPSTFPSDVGVSSPGRQDLPDEEYQPEKLFSKSTLRVAS